MRENPREIAHRLLVNRIDRDSRDETAKSMWWEDYHKLPRNLMTKLDKRLKKTDWHHEDIDEILESLFAKTEWAEKKYQRSFMKLSDTKIAEEIVKDGEAVFVVYDTEKDNWTFESEVKLPNGELVVPIPIDSKLLESLTLADGIERYSSLAELRKEMLALVLEIYDSCKNRELFELIMNITLTSWVTEWQSNMAERFMPIVNPRGPSETGKKRFLTVMRYSCYRSHYCLKVALVPTLFRSLDPWNATLIEDEADIPNSALNNEMVQFLNSRADGVPIPRYSSEEGKSEYFSSFGLTVLATRRSFTDDGLESRCIVYPTEGTERPEDYPLLPPPEWVEKAKRLQRKLLYFRLSHLTKGEMPSQLLIPGISSFRVRESLLMLEALRDEDPDIMKDISKIAFELQRRIIAERADSPEGLVLNVVYQYHDETGLKAVQHGDSYRLVRVKTENDERTGELKEIENEVLNLGLVGEKIGKSLSNREISQFWKGLGQKILQQYRLKGGGEKRRGILLITNPDRLKREFQKYVPDYDEKTIGDTYPAGTSGTSGTKQTAIDSEDVPHVPDVPPLEVSPPGGKP